MPGTVRTQARSTRTTAPRTATVRAPRATRIAAKTGIIPGWVWPVSGNRITSRFEPGHLAVDVGIPVGTPLYAPHAGTIAKVGYDTGGYGEHIVLNTLDGLQIYLGHLSEVNVGVGDNVAPGQQIGRTGNTGNSTGPHLHYEIRQGSGRIDPLSLEYGQIDRSIKATATPKPIQRTQANAIAPKMRAYATEIPPDPTKRDTAGLGVYVGSKEHGTGIDIAGIGLGTKGVSVSTKPFEDFMGKIPWNRVIIIIVGLVLIGLGVFSIASSEALKQVVNPVVQAVKGTG